MVKAKRARKVETLKQPSLYLRLRAPYFYPDNRMLRLTRRGLETWHGRDVVTLANERAS